MFFVIDVGVIKFVDDVIVGCVIIVVGLEFWGLIFVSYLWFFFGCCGWGLCFFLLMGCILVNLI